MIKQIIFINLILLFTYLTAHSDQSSDNYRISVERAKCSFFKKLERDESTVLSILAEAYGKLVCDKMNGYSKESRLSFMRVNLENMVTEIAELNLHLSSDQLLSPEKKSKRELELAEALRNIKEVQQRFPKSESAN